MTTAIAIIILIACGFLYYGWFRLRQEISAKITQLIFRKAHREGEGAVGRTHLITPKSVSAHALLEAAWEAIDVPASEKPPRWWPASVFKWRSDDPTGLVFQSKGRLTFTQWSATLLTDKEGTQLLWSVVQALQFNGLVPEARSLANLERRVIRAMRACDPYCEIISEQGKVKWK